MNELENSSQDGEWVTVTEAAKRLTEAGDRVSQSTLSRYLAQHAEAIPVREAGRAKMVDYTALRQHRSENVRLADKPRATAAAPQRRFAGSQADGAARKAQADAELREMDLAVRRGELTPTVEVDQAGRDAVALMQSAFDRAVETDAAGFALKYGLEERIWRVALKQFARHGLETFNMEIRATLDRLEAERAKVLN